MRPKQIEKLNSSPTSKFAMTIMATGLALIPTFTDQVSASTKPKVPIQETKKLIEAPAFQPFPKIEPVNMNRDQEIEQYSRTAIWIKGGKAVLPDHLVGKFMKLNLGIPLELKVDLATRRMRMHGQIYPEHQGLNLMTDILRAIILRSDPDILNQAVDKNGQIKFGEQLTITIHNSPNFNHKDFELPEAIPITLFNKGEDGQFNAYCGGTVIKKNGAEIIVTARHCADRRYFSFENSTEPTSKIIYISSGGLNPTFYPLKLAEQKLLVAGDNVIITPPNLQAIQLAKETVKEMFNAAQAIRNNRDLPIAITTFRNTMDTGIQPTTYTIPAKIEKNKTLYNQSFDDVGPTFVANRSEFSVKTNYAIGDSFEGGMSGSILTAKIGNKVYPLGVASSADIKYWDEKDIVLPKNLPNQFAAIIDPVDKALLDRQITKLEKLLKPSINTNNSFFSGKGEMLSQPILIKVEEIKQNFLDSRISQLVEFVVDVHDLMFATDPKTLSKINQLFEKKIQYKEQIEQLVTRLANIYESNLPEGSYDEIIESYKITSFLKASFLPNPVNNKQQSKLNYVMIKLEAEIDKILELESGFRKARQDILKQNSKK